MPEPATPTLPDSDWLPVCTTCHERVGSFVDLSEHVCRGSAS